MPKLLRHPAAPGALLALAAAAALVIANAGGEDAYRAFFGHVIGFELAGLELRKALILWINDGLMAIFFLLVGLEIKREFLFGGLKEPAQRIVPTMAAIGGMALPAIIYAAVTWGEPGAGRGWAIPAATDIAFALGALAVLGSRAPTSLKTLLLAIAILDDLGAILIIALFYTAKISFVALGVAVAAFAVLVALNRAGVRRAEGYLLVGVVLWVALLKSGLHATMAGVLVAATIPAGGDEAHASSPIIRLEHALSPFVNFGILPVFAFANAGVSLAGFGVSTLAEPIALGIVLGLFLGKQVGVFAGVFAAVKWLSAPLPEGANWRHIHGLACLTGIGFTMSLFIGGLAFTDGGSGDLVRIGVIVGSLASGVAGALLIATSRRPADQPSPFAVPRSSTSDTRMERAML